MKKVFLIFMVAALTAVTAAGQVKERREVAGFTGIDASSVFHITVTKGDAEQLTLETDAEVMQYVHSEVRKGVLHLWVDRDQLKLFERIKVLKATVVMRELTRVSLSGACKLTADDLFTSADFKADCSGAASMQLNVNTGKLEIDAAGACVIRLKASVTGTAELDVSGTVKVTAELEAGRLRCDGSGVSNLKLTGRAEDLSLDMSGASSVSAEDFEVKRAVIDSSGAGKMTLHVTDDLRVDASGASSIRYKGTPAVKADKSGASRIRPI
jgi:hypothetical protein